MAVTVTAGQKVSMALAYFDQFGNAFAAPTPDSPPIWAKTAADAVDTLSVAADGNTAVLQTVAAAADASDNITVRVLVSGKEFDAALAVTIQAATPVLSSVAIVPTVS